MAGTRAYPRRHRVRRRGDFELAYAHGRKRVGPGLVLFARPNGLAESRLGVTATRRYGNAVQRNRARRLMREAFRHVRPGLPGGYDYVFVVRGGFRALSLEQVTRSVETLVARATAEAS